MTKKHGRIRLGRISPCCHPNLRLAAPPYYRHLHALLCNGRTRRTLLNHLRIRPRRPIHAQTNTLISPFQSSLWSETICATTPPHRFYLLYRIFILLSTIFLHYYVKFQIKLE